MYVNRKNDTKCSNSLSCVDAVIVPDDIKIVIDDEEREER